MSHFATTHGIDGQSGQRATTHWVGSGDRGGVWVKGGELLRARLDPYWQKESHLERLWAVLHLVLERQAMGDQKSGFSPISTRLLAGMIGRDFAYQALQTLKRNGFLECDESYCPSAKAKGYRFSQEIASLEAQWYPLSAAFSGRIALWRGKRTNAAIGRKKPHRILWDHLQRLTLDPCFMEAMPAGEDVQLKRDAWRLSADAVCGQIWHFSSDPKSGRVFNNFTSLPKVMRRYALLDGEPLAEIDICNSQPFFLADLYPSHDAEWEKYVGIVSAGCFYEALNEASGQPIDPNNREKLKQAVYAQVLFGRNWTASRLWVGFKQLFPRLSQIVSESKARNHRLLPIELQRLEASVMIGEAVPAFAANFPGIPFLTIHDSIAVPSRLAGDAKQLLREIVTKSIGCTPMLKVTGTSLTASACLGRKIAG